VDRHRLDAGPDPNFHVDADPDWQNNGFVEKSKDFKFFQMPDIDTDPDPAK
jgi:hypothetical protein